MQGFFIFRAFDYGPQGDRENEQSWLVDDALFRDGYVELYRHGVLVQVLEQRDWEEFEQVELETVH